MHGDNSHLRTVLKAGVPDTNSPDDDSGLPSLTEGQYQAFSRPSNKPVHAVHFVDTRGQVRSYQYVHLDSDSRFNAESITLRFLGMEPTKVLINGRNLWRLYDYLHQHRACWVMTAPRDFAKDGDPIVSSVVFSAIKEGEGAEVASPGD